MPEILVTDPPYGMAYISNSSKYVKAAPIAADEDTKAREKILAEWGARPALVFGTWRIERPANIRQLLIWDKGDSPGMGDLSMPWGPAHEEIYVLGAGFKGKRKSNVLRYATIPPGSKDRPDHPTPKPVGLIKDLIAYCPDGIILDPFMGSGTTLRAAKDVGRKAIGIEIEERYCEVAANRMTQESMAF